MFPFQFINSNISFELKPILKIWFNIFIEYWLQLTYTVSNSEDNDYVLENNQ